MLKTFKSKFRALCRNEEGWTAGEVAVVVTIVLVLTGSVIAGVIDDRDGQIPDEMFSANEKLATKLIALVSEDATVAASNLTASIPGTSIPNEFKLRSGVLYGPHGGTVVPTGDGSRGLILTWNTIAQDYCQELLARYGGEDGEGRLTGISANTTAQTLPVGLAARTTACSETDATNILAFTYDVDKG